MAVPNSMADLATLAGSNSPAGSEAIGNSLDNYLRAHAAIIRSTNATASATIAAASTTDIGAADGESVQVTGSATITSLGVGFVGCRREVRFTGACTLTNSGNLALPNGANITTAAGDVISFRCVGASQWIMTSAPPLIGRNGGVVNGTIVSGATTGELRVGGQTPGAQSAVFTFDGKMASATGGVAGTFYTIYNSGNFDPSTKANLASPTFTGSGNPGAPAGYAVSASGSFGGGYRMIDGAAHFGWWTSAGAMNWGVGNSTTISQLMSLNGSGLLAPNGGVQFPGSKITRLTVSSAAPGSLVDGELYLRY